MASNRTIQFALTLKLDRWQKRLKQATKQMAQAQAEAAKTAERRANAELTVTSKIRMAYKRLGEAIRGQALSSRRGLGGTFQVFQFRRSLTLIRNFSRAVQAAFQRMGVSAAGRFVKAMGRGFRDVYRLAARMVERIRARWEKLRKTAQKVSKGIAKAFKLPLKVFKKFVSALRAISSVLLNVKFLATGAIAAFGVFKFAELAAKVSNMEVAFEGLTRALGEAPAQALEKLRKSLRGTVSDLDIARQVARASIFNIADDVDTLAKIFDTARRLGKATGRNTAQAIEDISLGIGRQSRLILDNIGLIVRVRRANEKYAFVLGKQVDDLTDLEKRFAFQAAALDAADEAMLRLGDDVETFGDKFYRLRANLENMSQSIAKTLTPIMTKLVDKLNDIDFDRIAKAFANFSGVAFEVMNKAIDRLNKSKGGIAGVTEGIINSINRGGRIGLTLLEGWVTRIHGIFTSGNIMGGLSTLMGDVLELAAGLIRELIKKIFTWDFWKGILTPVATILMNVTRVILLEISNMFKSMGDLKLFGGVFEALGDGLSFLTDNLEVASKEFLEGKKALLKAAETKDQLDDRRLRDKQLAWNAVQAPGGVLHGVNLSSKAGNDAADAWFDGWNEEWEKKEKQGGIYQRDFFDRIRFEDADGNVESGGSGRIADLFAKIYGFDTWAAIEATAQTFQPKLEFRKAFDGIPEIAESLFEGAVTTLDKALGVSRGKISKFAKWLDLITTTSMGAKSGSGGVISSFFGTAVTGPFAQGDDSLLGPVALQRMAQDQEDNPKIDNPISLAAIASSSGVTLSKLKEELDAVGKVTFNRMSEEVKETTNQLMLMETSMTRLVQGFDNQSATELEKILSIEGLEDINLDKLIDESGLQIKGEQYEATVEALMARIIKARESLKKAMTIDPAGPRYGGPKGVEIPIPPILLEGLKEFQRRKAALLAQIVAAEEKRLESDKQRKKSENKTKTDTTFKTLQNDTAALLERQKMSMDQLIKGVQGQIDYETKIIKLKGRQVGDSEKLIASQIKLNTTKIAEVNIDKFRANIASRILEIQKKTTELVRGMNTGSSYKERLQARLDIIHEEFAKEEKILKVLLLKGIYTQKEFDAKTKILEKDKESLIIATKDLALTEEQAAILAKMQGYQTAFVGGFINGIKEAALAGAKHYGSFVRSIYKQWAGMLDTFINETVTKIVGTMKSATVDFIKSMSPDIAELVGSLANALVGILATIGLSKDSANVTEVSEGDIQAGDTAVRGVIAGPQSVAISELGESIAEANRGVESLLSDILGVLEDIHGNNLTSGGIGSAGTI